jgi:hypothetical protein
MSGMVVIAPLKNNFFFKKCQVDSMKMKSEERKLE